MPCSFLKRNFLSKLAYRKNEIESYKSQHGHLPIGFLLGAIHSILPENLKGLYPERLRADLSPTQFWLKDFSTTTNNRTHQSLKSSLIDQIQISTLQILISTTHLLLFLRVSIKPQLCTVKTDKQT